MANLIPNGDYYSKLTADQLEAIKQQANDFKQSELAEDIRETFRPKTYEETWGGVIWALNAITLNFMHLLSAAAAFIGVAWVFSIIFLMIPLTDIPVADIAGRTALIGHVLAVLATIPSLYYIEKFKAIALTNLFSKTIPPTLRASLSRGDYWRLIANGLFWAAVSFATSLFGGIETPEAIQIKPETVQVTGLVRIDSTTSEGNAAVAAIQAQYNGLIATQQAIIDKNKKAATAATITNWGAYKAYNAAKTERQRLTTEMGTLVAQQQAINLAAIKAGSQDNTAKRATVDTINSIAAREYENKISFSAWVLGGASVVSDLAIILVIFFTVRFKYRVAVENDAINSLLFTVPAVVPIVPQTPPNDPLPNDPQQTIPVVPPTAQDETETGETETVTQADKHRQANLKKYLRLYHKRSVTSASEATREENRRKALHYIELLEKEGIGVTLLADGSVDFK